MLREKFLSDTFGKSLNEDCVVKKRVSIVSLISTTYISYSVKCKCTAETLVTNGLTIPPPFDTHQLKIRVHLNQAANRKLIHNLPETKEYSPHSSKTITKRFDRYINIHKASIHLLRRLTAASATKLVIRSKTISAASICHGTFPRTNKIWQTWTDRFINCLDESEIKTQSWEV